MLKNKQINRQKMLLSPGAGNFRGVLRIQDQKTLDDQTIQESDQNTVIGDKSVVAGEDLHAHLN